MKRNSRDKQLDVNMWLAVALCVLGGVLLIAGFTVPPLGIIDNSVLIAFGEISTFAGSLLGIDTNYKIKVHKMEMDSRHNEKDTTAQNI